MTYLSCTIETMNTCTGSGTLGYVSDYNKLFKSAKCPVCGTKVKVSFPDKMHENRAKFSRHKNEPNSHS